MLCNTALFFNSISLMYYSLMSNDDCYRLLSFIVSIIQLVYSLLKSKILSYIIQSPLLNTLANFSTMVSVILLLIEYSTKEKCMWKKGKGISDIFKHD